MSTLTERLKEYGADTDGAMSRFLNDEELYLSCLEQFVDDPGFFALEEAIASDDHQTAFDASHMLKGVAANMGLTPMFSALSAVVEPLRRKEYAGINELYAQVAAQRAALKKITD
ncbi:MAG: Hpt domain-containing protein [Cloacibacillus sp.]